MHSQLRKIIREEVRKVLQEGDPEQRSLQLMQNIVAKTIREVRATSNPSVWSEIMSLAKTQGGGNEYYPKILERTRKNAEMALASLWAELDNMRRG